MRMIIAFILMAAFTCGASTVVNKATYQAIYSAHTPDYPSAQWWINPVIPPCQSKYWKTENGKLAEMTYIEKNTVDTEEQAQQAIAVEQSKDIDNLEAIYRACFILIFEEINKLRVKTGLVPYTWEQFKTAIKNKI